MKTVRYNQVFALLEQAKKAPRGRKNLDVSETGKDGMSFFFNAFAPETYVQPHKHLTPEFFKIEIGYALVIFFDSNGNVIEVITLSSTSFGGSVAACRIPPDTWHSVIAHVPVVLLEAKEGVYRPENKILAPWAPSELDAPDLIHTYQDHLNAAVERSWWTSRKLE
ncbi:MAG: WbuC family cupin fold metalloprotein [Patescibacteria group bacterium]